jgi:hypothetical protein
VLPLVRPMWQSFPSRQERLACESDAYGWLFFAITANFVMLSSIDDPAAA